VGAPNRRRVRPRASASFGRRLAVEDDASWVVTLDHSRDLIVISDGDVLITGFFEKSADELLEEGFVLNE
jgi:hypothetical protein